jgi:hypothetical protein
MNFLSKLKTSLKNAALVGALGIAAVPAQGAGHEDSERRTFIFGHSLINNGSARSAVPYWMVQFAGADQKRFKFAGQYGFHWDHANNLPPESDWGFDGAPAFWDHNLQSFASAGFDSILFTPVNFVQNESPTANLDWAGGSTAGITLRVIDWVAAQEPGIEVFIYENWPEMQINSFPPTTGEFDDYNAFVLGGFSDWWDAYHDALQDARPDLQITSIPVGPIIAKMISQTSLLSGMSVTDFYKDGDPHGTDTTYFLASLITYAGMFETAPPAGINVPNGIHPVVKANYAGISQFIAAELGVD